MEKRNKIEEKVKIEIEEESSEAVKDIGFSINTGQSGQVEFVTELINGKLEAVMMSTDKSIEVEITFAEFEDIVLFSIRNFNGRLYLPLRISGIVKEGLNIPGSSEKWALNNRLRFRVKGATNTTANFIVRWC